MSNIRFTGIMPAMITPIDANGKVVEECVNRMVEDQLAAGVTGFYVTGGTGEGVLITKEQRFAMVEAVVKANRGRGKVIVHTGSINADEGIELTRQATAAGADGISSILPNIYFSFSYD
ncbi:MAG: dihydrodipicolinate synthase family protein, partial [Victivallales bacterium]|nr:dihydrodipicolinate synthase family protein [Victivallales bacterium]